MTPMFHRHTLPEAVGRACPRQAWLGFSIRLRAVALLVAIGAACSPAPETEPLIEPLWPAGFATSYKPVRPCRRSIDHDLGYVTIHADPTSTQAYETRDKPFPLGSIVLKVEYDDENCTTLRGFTVMKREAPGYDPDYGNWHWQKADAARMVTVDGRSSSPVANPPTAVDRCVKCHDSCGKAPDGFDGTCSAVSAR